MSRLPRFFLTLYVVLATTLAQADPPARVGRLALVENGVNFRVDADDQGAPASINWPISSGAMLETERRGRAEVWVGSTAFRLAASSQLEFPLVDDQQIMLRLPAGSLAVSIFDREQSAEIVVETPEGRVSFTSPGRYRIDVLSDHSELTTQAGQASFNDGEGATPVPAGQKARIYSGGRIRLDPDFDQDSFDNWVAERENAALVSASQRYVSPAMTGYQDLDRYGDWNTSAEYGAVWYPRSVGGDWAPYRDGRWAWVAPWGWTWIDESPWGFAPFHYGRWVHVRNRWGWVPGTYVARPVYAPALVAWIGNPGWSVSFRSGTAPAVGWFPLAPREVYVPGFRATPEYVRHINRTHVRDTSEIDRALRSGDGRHYVNRALPQAVTIVPSRLLSEGRPIRPAEIGRHDRRELERAPQAHFAPEHVALPSPVNRRSLREERRDSFPMRGRDSESRSLPFAVPAGTLPGATDQRPAGPTPLPNRDDARRGGFARDPERRGPSVQSEPVTREVELLRRAPETAPPVERSLPFFRQGGEGRDERRPQGFRELSPGRAPDAPRAESERRLPAVPAPVPVAREAEPARRAPEVMPSMPPVERAVPAFRQGSEGRDERRLPGSRELLPGRAPDAPRAEPERRLPAVPVPAPVAREAEPARRAPEVLPSMPASVERAAPAFRQGSDERRSPAFRENPPVQPSVREMRRDEREIQRREMPRQEREQPRSPEAAPRPMPPAPVQPVVAQPVVQPMRMPQAAPPQPAPAPAPAPRLEPRVQPPSASPAPTQQAPQQRGGRRDQNDERSGR